ncbi:4-vinyl reductase [Candidatus Woesearchaeota archaeon]|nr:4-vinyl reductase [Candidatus Woesearchaeota archaeon]
MLIKTPSRILERIMRFKALQWKEGKVLLWGIPGLIMATYVFIYLQHSIEKNYNRKQMMNIMYNLGEFQSKQAFKIMNKRFGYAKTLADKIKLIKLHLEWCPFVGLGISKIIKLDLKNKIFLIHGKSAIAEEYKKFFGIQKDNMIDHYIRGLLNSFIEELLKEKMFTVETRCIASGNAYCEFIIKPMKKWNKNDKLVKSQMISEFKNVEEMEEKMHLFFASKS